MEGKTSDVQFLCEADLPEGADVEVAVVVAHQSGRIRLPRGVARLDVQTRALLVLEAVHGGVLRLAQTRGWDLDALEQVRRQCLEERLDFRWNGPWKASPNRALEARGEFRLLDDGFGQTRVAVRDRKTQELVGMSPPAKAYCTSTGFQRSAKTLRWSGSAAVSMTPWSGILGDHGKLGAEIGRLLPWCPWPELEPVDTSSPRPSLQFVDD